MILGSPSSPTYRFVDGVSRGGPSSSALSHYDRSSQHPGGLVKQAYSAWVTLAPNAKPQKWHLTAYFTYSDLQNIPTIDQDPILRKLVVPAGIYRSGKARSRNDMDSGMMDYGPNSSGSSSASPPPMSFGTSHHTPHPAAHNLPSLHSAIPSHGGHALQSRNHGRLPEDQRMIQMLNSRHIL